MIKAAIDFVCHPVVAVLIGLGWLVFFINGVTKAPDDEYLCKKDKKC